ncbi:hypothetical protein AD947_09440 [Acetobacter tropicalis]|uniref:Lipoprotein n=1 Tax=Acetobacter tropicalis TaxID=104102 RepID=A0A149TVH1_9PROT|nr:hypothetical protein [Acetobacter tropicalis]KXV57151.1 hypothetical protein AD947_09440 [Acetobacter tropicalis]
MVYNWSIMVILTTMLAGCAQQLHHRSGDTPACMNYRSMMTAPMPPEAMQRLQKQCEDSMRATTATPRLKKDTVK